MTNSLKLSDLCPNPTSQAYVYSSSNWNTPHILDLRAGAAVSLVLLSARHFLLVS